MHIPDNYLSPTTCAVMTAAVIPAWVHSVKKLKAELPREKMVLLGVGAAFSFLGMMFNIPLPGGTTGHAVGGTLIAILLGPEAACVAVTIALLIQALLFGDGGILAFGANCFNMAFALPYVGYYTYKALRKALGVDKTSKAFGDAEAKLLSANIPDETKALQRRDKIAAGVGAYLGINVAALLTAIEFGIQPLLYYAKDGGPLYCPYGLNISIPAMMIGHLTIFGLAEVVFTVAIYSFLSANSSLAGNASARVETTQTNTQTNTRPLILLALLILATPLGLLAAGTAWGEWELEEVGIKEYFSWNSLMPDYTLEGIPEVAAYILSAIIGVTLLILLFRVIAATMKPKTKY